VLRPTQPPTLRGTRNDDDDDDDDEGRINFSMALSPKTTRTMSSSLRATGRRPGVSNWGGGMSASCKLWVQLFVNVGNGWLHSALWYH